MLRTLHNPRHVRLALFGLALVAGTTWGLYAVQDMIVVQERQSVRAFGIGYLAPVMVMTALAGRWGGRLTLWLSLAAAFVFLAPPLHTLIPVLRPRDDTGLALLLIVGEMVVRGLDRVRREMALVADVEQSPFTDSLQARVRAAAANVPGVAAVGQCAMRRRGLEYFLDLEVFVPGALSVTEGQAVVEAVEDAVRRLYALIGEVRVRLRPVPPVAASSAALPAA